MTASDVFWCFLTRGFKILTYYLVYRNLVIHLQTSWLQGLHHSYSYYESTSFTPIMLAVTFLEFGILFKFGTFSATLRCTR